jgi:hypothetical protein
MDVITQERLEAIADILCLRPSKYIHQGLHQLPLSQIPRILFDSEQSVREGIVLLNAFKRPPIVFCYVDFFEDLLAILKNLTRPIVLLTNGGDRGITEAEQNLLDHPMILRWFGSNARIRHPKLTPVPIGIANAMWPHGDISALERVQAAEPAKRPHTDLFFCFRTDTNRARREPAKRALEAQGYPFTQTSMDYETYLRTLASYRYAACPPGNGVDCHRVWECIALGVIPIVERDLLWDAWSGLPICQVDGWEGLVLEEVPFSLEVPYAKLSFWTTLIRAYSAAISYP